MRLLLLVLCLALPALADDPLVDGNPPLTQARVKDMHDFFQWALQAPLTQGMSDRLQALLVKTWQDGTSMSLQPIYDQISNLDVVPSGTRTELRATYRDELLGLNGSLGNLAREIDSDTRLVVVTGPPPLTRLAVEAFAEWYLFALGHEGTPPGDVFNDSMAVTLQQIYPKLTPDQQQGLANVASTWAALRARWPSMSAAEQTTLRGQWQTLLAPVAARRQPLVPAFQALQALRRAYQGNDLNAITTATQAVTAQAFSLRSLGTPEALALAGRLEALVNQADTLSEINSMSAEIADRTHLPLSDPDSIQPVIYQGFTSSWAAQDVSGLRFRW